MGVNKTAEKERSLCGFKGRNDRQKHGQRKRQTVTNNRLESNVQGRQTGCLSEC